MGEHRRRAWPTSYPKAVVAESLDGIKNLCFRFAAQSGLTISIDDVQDARRRRPSILDRHEKRSREGRGPVPRGIITDGERRQKEVEIWTDATDEVRAAMEREPQGRSSSTPST